jgi:hypothetical protein
MQAFIQILVCYIYCLRSSRLFQNRKVWFRTLKIIAAASISIYIVLILSAIIKQVIMKKNKDLYLSCTTDVYFAINFSQNVVLLFYCGVGCYLINKINKYVPNSTLEQSLHESSKLSYLLDLKICLVTFVTLFVVSNFYSIFLFVYVNNYS